MKSRSKVAVSRRAAAAALSGLIILPVTLVSESASASASDLVLESIAYEGFDYSPAVSNGQPLSAGNGGTGWSGAWTAGCAMVFNSSGLTYTGLTTEGGRAQFGSCSLNNELQRTLPRQDTGVVYLQFLSQLNTRGGGTPNIRLFDQGSFTGGIGNNDGGLEMAITPGLAKVDPGSPFSSGVPISNLNLTIVRIDHDADTTRMWVNPNLATFDYQSPPTPDATATNFSPAFDTLHLIVRQGTSPQADYFDEIKVLRLLDDPIPEAPEQRPPDWIQQYARSTDELCRTEWTPSWAQWPNEGSGGFVCTRILTWSHSEQGFVVGT